MYESVRIQNFRGFEDLTVDGLTRVNLIVGANDVGKTALLEALFLLAGEGNPELALRMNGWRALPVPQAGAGKVFENLFHGFRTGDSFVLRGTRLDRVKDTLQGRVVPVGADKLLLGELGEGGHEDGQALTFLGNDALETRWQRGDDEPHISQARFFKETQGSETRFGMKTEPSQSPVDPMSVFIHARLRVNFEEERRRFSSLVQQGRKHQLIEALRGVDGRISELELLSPNGESIIHANVGLGKMVPLGLLGDGAVRLSHILLANCEAEGGLLLVDELDTGLHHTILVEAWHAIAAAVCSAGNATQLFATTHSYECMTAAYEAFADHPEDFSMHRLERINGDIMCKSFGHETLGNALEHRMEVR